MGKIKDKDLRLGEEKINNQGCLMKIIEYNRATDIIVEFQDKYKARVHTNYSCFIKGTVRNPYHKLIYNVATKGDKYVNKNGEQTKEYSVWFQMIRRCFNKRERETTYKNVTCCDEWLNFENFYEWLHNQPNFDKWLNGDRWALDKDILIKGNKVYSPETCCLVPHNVNGLFTKHDAARGDCPIGVTKHRDRFAARCMNPFLEKQITIGYGSTKLSAFNIYKNFKENIIKQVAEIEYLNSNITKECYDAMMKYEVEITD